MGMEILAPVGGPANLNAAIYSGADAVYIGMSAFSARGTATNFSYEELIETVRFCHIRGVKVFVAVNTLIKDSEMDDVLNLCEFLCESGVDSLIVQDLGLFYMLRKSCPNLPIHCSTQMSLMGVKAVKLLEELGAKRAVLARELTMDEIKDIRDNTSVELEVFVHGALCMCVSGQCYFSAMLGSRSGNRGRCAQTCRLPFGKNGADGYDLSLKDLSFVHGVKKLEKIGVNSAKIEGRMKRPEYVAAAVSAYRNRLDLGVANAQIEEDLGAVFSRSGFTDGYLSGNINGDMFGFRRKEDVVKASSSVYASLHNLYKNEYQKISLELEIELISGEFPTLKITDVDGNVAFAQGSVKAEVGLRKTLSEDDIKDRFSKFGGTPYFVKNITVKTDNKSMISASALNEIRRIATEKLSDLRGKVRPIEFNRVLEYTENRTVSSNLKYRAEFKNFNQIPGDISDLEWIYLPLNTPEKYIKSALNIGVNVGITMPRLAFGDEKEIHEQSENMLKLGVKSLLCGNMYSVAIARELKEKYDIEIHGTYALNIMNSHSVKQFEQLGLSDIEMSMELKKDEVLGIKSTAKRGLMVYGRQALMIVRNCPIRKNTNSCKNCSGQETLIDRMKFEFPVVCSKYRDGDKIVKAGSQYSEILNSRVLHLQNISSRNNIDFAVLRFTTEDKAECEDIIKNIINGDKLNAECTNGLFARGVI